MTAITNGSYTFTLDGSLDHQTANDPIALNFNTAETVGALTIQPEGSYTYTLVNPVSTGSSTDQFTYTLTGTNSSISQTTLTFNPATVSVPVISVPAAEVLERNLNPVTTVDGHVTASYSTPTGTITENGHFSSTNGFLPLTSGGQAITVTQSGEIYTGQTAGGTTAFIMDVHADGSYAFTLDAPLDHLYGNSVIGMNFGINATDANGSATAGNITVLVTEDAPYAFADVNNFSTSAGSTTGNVITGANEVSGGADYFSKDGNNHVAYIYNYNNTEKFTVIAGQATIINGQYGDLTINSDGSYKYVLHSNVSAQVATSDQFYYGIADNNGSTSQTTLTFNSTQPATPVTELLAAAQAGNLAGVETILKHTTAADYAHVASSQLDQVLQAIDQNLYSDHKAADLKVLGNFLSQTVTHIDGITLMNEISDFAQANNLDGVAAILSHTSAATFATISTNFADPNAVVPGWTFDDITRDLYTDHKAADFKVLNDFLSQAITHIQTPDIINEITNFFQSNNSIGAETILAHTSAATFAPANVNVYSLNSTLHTIDQSLYTDHKAADLKVLGDYLAQTAAHTDLGTLATEVKNFAAAHNTAGESTILAASPALVPHVQTSGGDSIDLSNLVANTSAVQASINNFIHATTSKGNTVVSVDVLGTGKAADFVTVGTLHGVSDANLAHLIAQHHLVV